MQQPPGPMIQARLARRNGIWQGPDGHRPDGHRIDEVESGAGVPEGATDGSPPERRPCRTVARTAAARWDGDALAERILESQRRRRLVSRSRERSTPDIWDYQPIRDASQDYIRNTMTLWEIEGRSRFPRAGGPAVGS